MRTRTDTRVPLRRELTDVEWQLIKDSLARVGKDADQLTVPTIKGEPLLRKALPLIADAHVLDARLEKQAPTLKQAAAELKKTQKIATELLERLSDRSNYDFLITRFRQMFFEDPKSRAELLIPLKGFIAELEKRLEAMAGYEMGIGSPRRTNARKVRNQFWNELTYLWQSFDPKAGRFKRRHLQRFLFACSKPFFLDVTDSKIAAFLDHYFSDQR
jgi:hypothetical protein